MAHTLTIRERIKGIQRQVLNGEYTPATCRENLLALTALYGLVLLERREADYEYAVTLEEIATELTAVSRAKIRAATTPQYQRAREAADTERLVIEMIRATQNLPAFT